VPDKFSSGESVAVFFLVAGEVGHLVGPMTAGGDESAFGVFKPGD
jgi:hypothetical protein